MLILEVGKGSYEIKCNYKDKKLRVEKIILIQNQGLKSNYGK